MGDTKPDVSAPPPQVLQQETSGFSFVIPTEFVDLPSKGRHYPETHPLHNIDSIEIKQMTAKEEDILTSRTLLKKGVALDRVIHSLILDKQVDPDSLLVGDRNAIIIASRVSGYGNEYTTSVTCPGCTATQEFLFDLNEANIYEGDNVDTIDVADNGDGTFTTALPRTKLNVTLRLLTGRDEKNLLRAIENDRKRKRPEQTVTHHLRMMITAINGDTDPEAIEYLIANIPSMDSRHLRLAYRLAAPNIDLTQHFECAECDYEADMEVPLTADFFWPDR
tara:strand:- start:346 stop:1179 length:834 start_codon:yes stop_codon:yes gene_type:complete